MVIGTLIVVALVAGPWLATFGVVAVWQYGAAVEDAMLNAIGRFWLGRGHNDLRR